MVSMLASGAVDHGFIGGVMVTILASGAVDHGFIGGKMVSMLASGAVDHGFISTAPEASMLTITPKMNP
jgi:ABC-type taurine transport system substrate-binding protein